MMVISEKSSKDRYIAALNVVRSKAHVYVNDGAGHTDSPTPADKKPPIQS